jgi:hypothetical protein
MILNGMPFRIPMEARTFKSLGRYSWSLKRTCSSARALVCAQARNQVPSRLSMTSEGPVVTANSKRSVHQRRCGGHVIARIMSSIDALKIKKNSSVFKHF